MFNLLVGLAVKFGVSSVMGNIATKLITESGKRTIDKVGIGFGSLILTEMITDVTTKHYCNKVDALFTDKNAQNLIEKTEETIKQAEDDIKDAEETKQKTPKKSTVKKSTKKKEEVKDGGEISE